MTQHSATRRQFVQGLSRLGTALGVSAFIPSLRFADAQQARLRATPEDWYKPGPNNSVSCGICPHNCHLVHGQTGICGTHVNQGGRLYTTAWANPIVLQPDAVEEAPLYHMALRIDMWAMYVATAGSVLQGRDDMGQVPAVPQKVLGADWTPPKVVRYALIAHDNIPSLKGIPLRVLAFGYGSSVASLEYCLAIAKEGKSPASEKKRLATVMVTTGYINEKPLNDILPYMDAFVFDLKGLTDETYQDHWAGKLAPILNAMKVVRKAGKWIEIRIPIVPGQSDDLRDVESLCQWILQNLGQDVPVHFFFPMPKWKMSNVPRTPVATLQNCRDLAMKLGLKYVYLPGVPGHNGNNTFCPSCGACVVRRIGVKCLAIDIDKKGRCMKCKYQLPGIWADN